MTPRQWVSACCILGAVLLALLSGWRCSTRSVPSAEEAGDGPRATPSAGIDTSQITLSLPTVRPVVADSFKAALQQFAGASPTRADSLRLRRWADSLQTRAARMEEEAPLQARSSLREVLRASRLLRDSSQIASATIYIGRTFFFRSNYEEALSRCRQALRVAREAGDRPSAARALNQIGIVYKSRGQYQRAQEKYQSSLKVMQGLNDQKGESRTLNNIGNLYKQQGRYERALKYYRSSLEIDQEIGYREGVAKTLNNIGLAYYQLEEYDRARTHLQKTLSLKRELGKRAGVARTLNNLGVLDVKQDRYAEAVTHLRTSLSIKRELGDDDGVVTTLNNIGEIHRLRGDHQSALELYREALQFNRQQGRRKSVLLNLENIGTVHLATGRPRAAADTLSEAVSLAEGLRRSATSPEARRSLLSTQIDAYRALSTAYLRAGQPDSVLRSTEQARARALADRLSERGQRQKTFSIPSATRLRKTLDSTEVALLYTHAGTERPLTVLAVTGDTTYARRLPDSTVRSSIEAAHPVLLNRLRRVEGPLSSATGDPGEDGSLPSLTQTLRLYRSQLTSEQRGASIRADLSRRFYRLLIGPVEEAVEEADEIIVVPSGPLGFLPFEALRDGSGTYLIERTDVRYAQSLTVLRQLQKQKPEKSEASANRNSLLAVGGADYGGTSPTSSDPLLAGIRGDLLRRRGRASSLHDAAERRIREERSLKPIYSRLGYRTWPNLYGTRLEVRKLQEARRGPTVLLTGGAASEERIRRMSASGELARHGRIHFATHGLAVPETPKLSALVLSQVGASDSLAAQDGYLTMPEIAELNLGAGVVVLSACRTGLGRIVEGEGVLNLSHAFLRAGAGATLVSQWRVLDWSTQQFMTALYRRAAADTTTFAEATAKVKRKFIGGQFGERGTDPLRWAPFVYYGRE